MSSLCSMSLMRHVAVLFAAATLALGSASAQLASSPNPSSSAAPSATESSSLQLLADNDISGVEGLPSAPSPAGAGAGAGAGQASGYQEHSIFSHLTFEGGGGFNGPTGSTSDFVTWGGNLTVGAGYRFNPRFSLLTEYQFIDDKLPGRLIAQTGANGGNTHIWSFTLAPVVDLFPKSINSLYVTGGGGFYRKVTNFTNPMATQYCDYYYCGIGYVNQVVGHFSSNQGGWNIGGGYTHRLGGMYGEGKVKLFAEVRYLDVLTPEVVGLSPSGLGTITRVPAGTKIIPVTFGVRW